MSGSDTGSGCWARQRRPGVAAALLAAAAGSVAVAHAVAPREDAALLLLRQGGWLIAGGALLLWCASRSADDLLRLAPLLTGLALGLLGAALGVRWLLPAGPTATDSDWLGTGAGLTREWLATAPAELAKPAFALFLARWAPALRRDPPFGWQPFAIYLGLTALWLLPLALLPDPGLALVAFATYLIVYWLQGGGWRQLLAATAAAAAGLAALYALLPDVRRQVLGALPPDNEFTRAALAAGGALGRAAPGGWARYYLPGVHRENAFAGLVETLGLAGTLPLLLLLAAFIALGLRAARRQPTQPRALALAGLVLMLALPALLHVSVAVGLFPPLPFLLPFVGFGGGAVLGTLFTAGALLSLWGDPAAPAAAAPPPAGARPAAGGSPNAPRAT